MIDIIASNQFKKDLRLLLKRNYNMNLLDKVISKLASGIPLDKKYKDHSLSGNYVGFRECHVAPDWLLIYRLGDNPSCLFLTRTGSHSDLF